MKESPYIIIDGEKRGIFAIYRIWGGGCKLTLQALKNIVDWDNIEPQEQQRVASYYDENGNMKQEYLFHP